MMEIFYLMTVNLKCIFVLLKDALSLCFTKIIKPEKCILNFIQCFMVVTVKFFDFLLLVKITLLCYFS